MEERCEKSVLQVRHTADRRMSPSAMFLHTPAAAHDARRGAVGKPLLRPRPAARPSFVSVIALRSGSPGGQGEAGSPPEVCRLPPPHFGNGTTASVTLAAASSGYSRVYNPGKSPRKAARNSLQVPALDERWVRRDFLSSRGSKSSLRRRLFHLFCFVLFWLEAKTPFWRLFTTVRQRALRLRRAAFWESESFTWQRTGVNRGSARRRVPVVVHYVTVYESVLSRR